MTSVLLVPYHPPGHIEPMAALGGQLRASGHTVTVFAESATTRWGVGRPVPPELSASADSGALFRHLFLGDVAGMARDVADLARAGGAELIVADVMMPGGGLAAELTGLPWVSLSCSPLPALDAYRTFIPPHAAASFAPRSTLEALGLPVDDDRNLLGRTSGRLHLIPTTPSFAGFPELPAQVALVGPLTPVPPEPAEPPADPDARPTVAVTASTADPATLGGRAFAQDRYLAAAVEALAGLAVTGLVTHQATGRPAANVRFLGRVPHGDLFDRCAAVVTHAGWGTVSRALVRGLPLVLVPVTGDQPYIAARCAELGLGIALSAETVTAAELREAVRAVLAEPRYRKAARELAAELRAVAPLATAESMITRCLSQKVDPHGH
jgi:UDP:flavonoid glycosyltransferase YjiC (YdhE family)